MSSRACSIPVLSLLTHSLVSSVMRDLHILHEQQQESKRKLDAARSLKQRRLQEHAALESKLQQLKYEHGQLSAELQRMHQLLSQGQRALHVTRMRAAKSGDDLRDLENMLSMARETKRTILCYQRKVTRLMECTRNDITSIKRLHQDAEEQIQQARHEVEKAKQHAEALRQELKECTLKLQHDLDETGKVRSEILKIDRELDGQDEDEKNIRDKAENVNTEKAKEQARHEKLRDAFASAREEHQRFHTQMDDRCQAQRQETLQKDNELRSYWERTVEIQLAENHVLERPSTDQPPALDIPRIKDTDAAENTSLKDENASKEELKLSVKFLRLESTRIDLELRERRDIAQKLETASEMEKQRRCEADTFRLKFRGAADEVKKLHAALNERRARSSEELVSLDQSMKHMIATTHKKREVLEHSNDQLSNAGKELDKLTDSYNETKVNNEIVASRVQEELDSLRKLYEDVGEEHEFSSIDGLSDALDDEPDVDLHNEELLAEIAELVEGEHSRFCTFE